MDDTSSTPPDEHDIDPVVKLFSPPRCRFCGRTGKIVETFPRRGYGGGYAESFINPCHLKGG